MITNLVVIHNKSGKVIIDETYDSPAIAKKRETHLRLKYFTTKQNYKPYFTVYKNTTSY